MVSAQGGRVRVIETFESPDGTIHKGSTGVITWVGDDISTVQFDNSDGFGIDVRNDLLENEVVKVPSADITGGTIVAGDWCYVKKSNNVLNHYEGKRVQVKHIGLRVLVEVEDLNGPVSLEIASAWLQKYPDEAEPVTQAQQSSYHLKPIVKGVFGEFSKITEEIEELQDAKQQDNQLLILVELSDLLGAIEGYTQKYHNISLEQLYKMTKLTRKAFESGHRS